MSPKGTKKNVFNKDAPVQKHVKKKIMKFLYFNKVFNLKFLELGDFCEHDLEMLTNDT